MATSAHSWSTQGPLKGRRATCTKRPRSVQAFPSCLHSPGVLLQPVCERVQRMQTPVCETQLMFHIPVMLRATPGAASPSSSVKGFRACSSAGHRHV